METPEKDEKTKTMKLNKLRQQAGRAIRKAFTLVELLVVVAIIAVVGAGVAVTYNNLDDQAKTAMEVSDIAILKKVTKHWSAINDYKIPNEMDSLVDSEGNIYSSYSMHATASSSGKGLNGPLGYAGLMVHAAPSAVLSNLSAAGMTLTYTHLVTAANANDSTFTMSNGQVVTTATKKTLVAGNSTLRTNAQEFIANSDGSDLASGGTHDYTAGSYSYTAPTNNAVFGPYASEADWQTGIAAQQAILSAATTDKLAFIHPGGGATGPGLAAANPTLEIITNAGLRPEEVAVPGVAPSGQQKYYLVVMGFGKFASINRGKSIRSDTPSYGKRLAQKDSDYNRYLAVFRVPATSGGFGGPPVEPVALIDVLSPQGYSVEYMRRTFMNDQTKLQDNS